MLTSVLSFLSGIKMYLYAGVAVIVLGLTITVYIEHLKLNEANSTIELNKTTYEKAQAQANVKALKDKQDTEHVYEQKAQAAQQDYTALASQYHATVLRYQAASRTTRLSNLPVSTEASAVLDRPSGDTFVPTADLYICADNTAKLEKARDWALSLQH